MPGQGLAMLYKQFGARLLEQNVRSFLQFTGKINRGIRKTINEESHMFLAYNNGISATADNIDWALCKKNQQLTNCKWWANNRLHLSYLG